MSKESLGFSSWRKTPQLKINVIHAMSKKNIHLPLSFHHMQGKWFAQSCIAHQFGYSKSVSVSWPNILLQLLAQYHFQSAALWLQAVGSGPRGWLYWPALMRRRHHGLLLGASVAILPVPSAAGAEDGVTGRAGHSGGVALGALLHITHSLTFKHRAPGFTGVKLHSCGEEKNGWGT